jgi:hypothetical protein
MSNFLIIYTVYFLSMLRGIFLAMGRPSVKIGRENFLFYQALSLSQVILLFVASFTTLTIIIASLSALLLAGFYLQPTPRISRYVLYFLIALSAVALAALTI